MTDAPAATAPAPRDRPRVESVTSQRIKVARVVCILALVFVHVPPYVPALGNPARALDAFDYLFVFLGESLSRTSVPLLSILSGYLLIVTDAGARYLTLLRRKARSLLLPLLLWNLVSAALNMLAGDLAPASWMQWVDRLLAITDTPLIQPLYFLRDIFVCIILFPILSWGLRRQASVTILVAAALAVAGVLDILLINSLILVFFISGCAIALGVFPIRRLPSALPVIIAFMLIALVATLKIAMALDPALPSFLSFLGKGWRAELFLLVQRTLGALFFWHVAIFIMRTSWGSRVAAIEPFIFFQFCAHTLLLGMAWRVLTMAGVDYGDPAYIAFFLTSPFTTFAGSLAGASVMLAVAPWALKPLCGGRLPSWRGFRRSEASASVGG